MNLNAATLGTPQEHRNERTCPMRREYEMTEEHHKELMEASRPVPYMVIGGVEPISPYDRAMAVWREMGRDMGFDPMSVRPAPGKSDRFFCALARTTTEETP